MSERPSQNSAIEAEAAHEAARELLGMVEVVRGNESPDDLERRVANEILSVRPEMRHSIPQAARKLGERLGFRWTPDVEDLLAGFDTSVANLVAEKVRDWVSETKPKAPFAASARVTLTPECCRKWGIPQGISGVAIRTLELDRSAYVRLVLSPFVEDFISSRGRRGYNMVDWEGIATASPVSDDREIEVVKIARLREQERVSVATPPLPKANVKPVSADLVSHDHGKVLATLLDAAKEALEGPDEDEARSALAAVQRSLETLARHESTRGRVRLTSPMGLGLGR